MEVKQKLYDEGWNDCINARSPKSGHPFYVQGYTDALNYSREVVRQDWFFADMHPSEMKYQEGAYAL